MDEGRGNTGQRPKATRVENISRSSDRHAENCTNRTSDRANFYVSSRRRAAFIAVRLFFFFFFFLSRPCHRTANINLLFSLLFFFFLLLAVYFNRSRKRISAWMILYSMIEESVYRGRVFNEQLLPFEILPRVE